MAEVTYEGIPRDRIPWDPKIDYKKCVSCGKCVEFCHVNVFGIEKKDGKKKTIVKNQNACIVYCRGCEDICLTGAITHPSEEETEKIIEHLKRVPMRELRRNSLA